MKQASFYPNPALVSFFGLAPLVGVSSSFAAGSIAGLTMALGAVTASAVGSLSRNRIPGRVAISIQMAFAAVYASICWMLVEAWSPAIAAQIGMYLPLIAASSFVMHELGRSGTEGGGRLKMAAISATQYFSVALIVSAFREVLGAGTFTLPLPVYSVHPLMIFSQAPLPFFQLPAGSFLVLALLAVVNRFLFSAQGAKEVPQ
ncbi:MAG TPA: Rnf-Nqr domain containing protein [Rectinemataceae bacterium]|nr:Rnf-Nqr domain containing protein [Rectinemataceae bacterium]